MQRYVPKALVMMAPYVNSYRRLTPDMSCPVNNAWGYDNRTTAFRVPVSDPAARRVENRLPELGCEPLSRARSLACLRPARHHEASSRRTDFAPTEDTANEGSIDLPRGLLEAVVAAGRASRHSTDVSRRRLHRLYAGVKRGEFETFMQVISPWEREFLLLNV
jgi:glutamine synthetase